MKFLETSLPGVILIEPEVHEDARGFFFESYHKEMFSRNGIETEFVQDNHSRSAKGVLRGLHYQVKPKTQAKLVRVMRGEAYDVVVDIRKGSKTFGRYMANILSEENRRMIYVPIGFAHGFLSLKDDTEFLYKTSDFYSPSYQRGIVWNDSTIQIPWPKLNKEYLISDQDRKHPLLKDAEPFGGNQC